MKRKLKNLACSNCGCDRRLMVKAELIEQVEENSIAYKYKTLCVNCFLRVVNAILPPDGQIETDTNALLRGPHDKLGDGS